MSERVSSRRSGGGCSGQEQSKCKGGDVATSLATDVEGGENPGQATWPQCYGERFGYYS